MDPRQKKKILLKSGKLGFVKTFCPFMTVPSYHTTLDTLSLHLSELSHRPGPEKDKPQQLEVNSGGGETASPSNNVKGIPFFTVPLWRKTLNQSMYNSLQLTVTIMNKNIKSISYKPWSATICGSKTKPKCQRKSSFPLVKKYSITTALHTNVLSTFDNFVEFFKRLKKRVFVRRNTFKRQNFPTTVSINITQYR